MSYTLNFYGIVNQLYLNLKKKKKKEAWITPQLVLPSEGLLPFVTWRGHSPSLRHWLAASDEGGGKACRMRGSHAAEGRFSRERKLVPCNHPAGHQQSPLTTQG